LTGAIPLLAIPFKLISNILPTHFQYFGWWLLACYLLQGYFAVKLFKSVGLKTPVEVALCAIYLPLSSALLWRSGHMNLCAHWLILWSFWIYYAAELTPIRRFKQSLLIIGVTALIHQYLLLMVLGLMFAISLNTPVKWWLKIGWNLANIALFVVIWWLIGNFLVPTDSVRASGFGYYSANLNAFWNATDAGSLMQALPRGKGQYEGVCYLGWGIIFVLSLHAWKYIGRLVRMVTKTPPILKVEIEIPPLPHTILFSVALLFALFSFSNVGMFGDKTLWNIEIFPYTLLGFLCDSFRSSGRFIWVMNYWLMFFALYEFLRPVDMLYYYKLPLLFVLFILQIQDLKPSLKRENIVSEYAPPLQRDIWRDLTKDVDKLVMYPAYGWTYQHYLDYMHFALVAVENKKAITTGYLARGLNGLKNQYSQRMNDSFDKGELGDAHNSLIVSSLNSADGLLELQTSGKVTLFLLDNYLVAIPTHRADLLEKVKKYAAIQPFKIELQTLDSFLMARQDKTILIAAKDEASQNLCASAKQYFEKLGSNIQKLGFRSSYLGILHKGQLISEQIEQNQLLQQKFSTGQQLKNLVFLKSVEMESAGAESANIAKIIIDNTDFCPNHRGLNLVVLDSTFRVVENVYFDTYKSCLNVKK
jgi:hypothetical protein